MLDFLAYLEFERGLSRNTLEAYRGDLLQLGRFLGERHVSALEASPADISDFLTGLATGDDEHRPASPATIHRKSACLRSFYRHLRREGLRESDPTATLSAPRRSRKLPQVLRAARSRSCSPSRAARDPHALRDRALLELMYASGLRASEAIGLELGDVDLEERVLRARGKGSKERIVPIGQAALEALTAYLERGRPKLVKNQRRGAPVRELPRRAAHPPGALQDRPPPRAQRRPGGPHEPAHAAPHVRHAPARGRLRPALGAGDAGPRRRLDDAALHAPVERAAQGRLLQGAPARDRRGYRAAVRAGLAAISMPELPEVETIRRQLAPALEGRRIVDVEVLDPRWCEPAPPEAIEDAVRGRRSSAPAGAAST